jgi:hypothetical protein
MMRVILVPLAVLPQQPGQVTTEVMVAASPKGDDHKHPMPDMGDMGGIGM